MARMLLAVLIVLSAGQAGCKRKLPTIEEMKEQSRKELAPVLEKHRAAATAKLEAIKAVAADAKAAAPVAAREPASVLLAGSGSGLLLANLEWAEAANGSNTAKLKARTELPIGALADALANGHVYGGSYNVAGVDQQFGLLARVTQAALIRIQKYDAPAVADGKRFKAGRAAGDVLIYDLDTRKRIAAFPFEAVQGDQALVDRRGGEALVKELEQNFARDFAADIEKESAAFAKGQPGPVTPGAAADAGLQRFADKILERLRLDHLLAGPKQVDFATAADGTLLVTIRAENPGILAGSEGKARPDVHQAVVKILGRDATVAVLQAGP